MTSPRFEDKSQEARSYVINKKSFYEREILVYANPLYGMKQLQKGSEGTCFYHCLNYIRCRYHDSSIQYPLERNIEKIFSDARRKLGDLFLSSSLLSKLVDTWFKTNKLDKDTKLNTDQWIKFLKFNSEKNEFSVPGWSKEKNKKYLGLAYEVLDDFFYYFHSLPSGKVYTFEEVKEHLFTLNKVHTLFLTRNILVKDLQLDFTKLAIDFLKTRNIKSSEINSLLASNDLLVYAPNIFMEQQVKFNNLHFFTKNILKSLSVLLDVIEKNGPLVFNYSSEVLQITKESLIKTCSGFSIYQIEFEDKPIKGNTHAMILVGGGIDREMHEFVYLINPNNSYTEKGKTPIYQISFEKFKKNLLAYEQPETFTQRDGQTYSLIKNFFIYSKQGLKPTRDPVPMEIQKFKNP